MMRAVFSPWSWNDDCEKVIRDLTWVQSGRLHFWSRVIKGSALNGYGEFYQLSNQCEVLSGILGGDGNNFSRQRATKPNSQQEPEDAANSLSVIVTEE